MVYSDRPQTPCLLFVDDREPVRRFVKLTLEPEGYEVLTARNSLEALALATDFPGPIDVLLTDMETKAFHNGSELAECFAILRPETVVMATSSPMLRGVAGETARPFSKERLVRAVGTACLAQAA